MPNCAFGRLGLAPGTTYEQAEQIVRAAKSPRLSRDYVAAVKRLVTDERVQGETLVAKPQVGE